MNARQLHDLGMIQNPDNWPIWPLLPMKRKVDGQLEMGFFLSPSLYGNTVAFYIGNIHDRQKALELDMSPEQVIQDGWRVD